MPVVTAVDAKSKNAIPPTRMNGRIRSSIFVVQDRPATGFTPQIVFSESCNSPNTPLALTSATSPAEYQHRDALFGAHTVDSGLQHPSKARRRSSGPTVTTADF